MALQVPDAQVGGEALRIYRSSRFAERAFCQTCGTHIFHRPQDGPELAVSAGLFAGTDYHLARELFFDAKPSFYGFVSESRKITGLGMTLEWLPRLAWRRFKRLFSK